MHYVWQEIASITLVCSLFSCSETRRTNSLQETLTLSYDSLDMAYPVEVSYARGFTVENHPSYKRLTLLAPDTSDTLASYILYPRGSTKPQLMDTTGCRYIPIPVTRLATLSTTEVGALPILGLRDALVAVANPLAIHDSLTRERIAQGKIAEIGRGIGRSMERIMLSDPDILLESFSDYPEDDKKLQKAGIEPILWSNWREAHPLGRAEWLKVIALLFGRNTLADSAFRSMVASYEEARQLTKDLKGSTPIIYGLDYKGVWYIPGEHSYQAQLFRDAGISYEYAEGQSESRPTDLEWIYARHGKARLWLCSMTGGIESKADLLTSNERYAQFEAFKSGQIWVDRKRATAQGSNDYWEGAPYQPHLLLRDLIKISHPELLPDYETTYWKMLK